MSFKTNINFVFRLAVLMAFALTGSVQAFAADQDTDSTATTTTKKSDAVKGNKVEGAEVVDEMITNNNLRALSGSTSLLSIASSFNYNGGTVKTPLSQDRPNISGASATTIKSDLDGSISGKYSLSAVHSILAGVGVRWISPLQAGGPSNYTGTVHDVMNPYLTYQFIYKWLGVQSVLQLSGTQITQADQVADGYDKVLNLDQENMYEIGTSGVSIGVSAYVQYDWFNKTGNVTRDGDLVDVTTRQSEYSFGFIPELEYQINDKYNLRTLITPWVYEHYRADGSQGILQRDGMYQSVGLGISVTRDIFLYPNIQYLPLNAQLSLTNVALAATINLF